MDIKWIFFECLFSSNTYLIYVYVLTFEYLDCYYVKLLFVAGTEVCDMEVNSEQNVMVIWDPYANLHEWATQERRG